MRRRIVALVRDYPGLHLREVARQLDTSVALVEYHLPRLVDAGHVHAERTEGFLRLFPRGDATMPRVDPDDRVWVAALREHNALQIVLLLAEAGAPVRHKDIAERLGMGKSRLSFHANKLEAIGLLRRDQQGLSLVDPARTQRLLVRHRPTPDLRDRFASLWLAFYGE